MHVHLILSLVYFPHPFLTFFLCYGYIFEMSTEGFILLLLFYFSQSSAIAFFNLKEKKRWGGGAKLLTKI